MKSNLSVAVAAILGSASAYSSIAAAADTAETAAAPEALGEIMVTAQRRTESMQDVPISMQAFTGQALQQLNVETFDDYIKYLPNVTSANNGPGQNEVFMRGLSAGAQPSQGSGSTGLYPNVAIYLDNQSGQLPNRNLDIYAADLDRIEVLEGPQGTLFGSGAEAGAIRYITNAPKLDVTEGNIKAGYGVTAHGDPNTDMTAVLNLPIIANTLAIRAVIYSDHRGGYIDNVPATFARKDTDIGIHYANYPAVNGQCPDGQPNGGFCVPPGSPTVNNNALAGRAINPVTYQGTRVEALYKFNDDWDLLVTQSYQDMDSRGVFYQQPNASDGAALRPLEATLFNNAYDKDRFESTAWTLNGKLGPLKAVYTGGYLVRNVDQVGDYTNYARGFYADYYQCYGPGSGFLVNGGAGDPNLKSTCFSPSAYWRSDERNTHQQHEFRLSTPDDWRWRAIAGVFWEDNKLFDQTGWYYKNVPSCTSTGASGTPGNSGCFSNIGTAPGATVVNPGEQGPNLSFYQDTMRETKQTAAFFSTDFDIIPKVLTITAGTRHFRFANQSVGSVSGSFYCFEQGAIAGGCLNDNYDLNAQNLHDTESGFKSRGNITWHITQDAMVYYTFSQGFRPGGFNQNGGTEHAYGPDGQYQYAVPHSYTSDKLTNNEIGWKTEFFDHHLQWNGAVYRENWDNVQVAFFDPGLVGNIFYNTNGQNFVIKGIETSFVARVVPGLMVQGAASWNHSRQTNSPQLIDNVPGSVNQGKPITVDCDATGGSCAPITNPFGPIGSPSANAPPIQFSLRARYDWSIGDYMPFAQIGAAHTGHSFTQAGSNPTIAEAGAVTTGRLRFENPAYTTFDASFGVAKDAWVVTVYGENLSNSNASTFTSTDQFIVEETPLRPRVIGASFAYKF
ncbi:MAG TPA: TonB-dependent receptor [Steroidobacteraceae bacterium]|jgi:outer membrane receptor protein involved in Fe transport|nr:TonB-dependent receptor [Steroidobacteraceae bacterium]